MKFIDKKAITNTVIDAFSGLEPTLCCVIVVTLKTKHLNINIIKAWIKNLIDMKNNIKLYNI